MAYTLKSTGIAAKAKAIVAVDEDGTLKEFVNGWTPGAGLIKHANVTTSGTASFRDAGTRKYFETFDGGSSVPQGVAFTTNIDITRTNDVGLSGVVVMAGSSFIPGSVPSFIVHLQETDQSSVSLSHAFRLKASTSPAIAEVYLSGGARAESTSNVPVDGTTKFTLGFQYLNSGTDEGISAGGQTFYLPESSAGSVGAFEPSSPTNPGWQYWTASLTGVGGSFQPDNNGSTPNAAYGHAAPGKYFLWAVFDSLLTLAEYQALHDDWFGTLFEATASPTITLTDPVAVVTGSTASCTITRSEAASGNITYNLTSSNTGIATVPATATILDGQTTGSFNITGVSAGSSTITATNAADSGETDTATANVSALKGLTVTFGQTGLTGLTFAWFDEASPDLFAAPTVVGTTESTDGSGVLEINLTGTSVAVGNTGFLLIYKAGATAPDDLAFFGRLTVQDIG